MKNCETLLCPNEEKLSPKEIKKSQILFVCTGNTCRSPMAAALFNHLYTEGTRLAVSAGIAADGSPIAKYACEALMKRGVLPTAENDYPRHISRAADDISMENAELIVGMTASHANSLIMKYPSFATKITVMPEDIPDPFGGSQDDYDRCLSAIEKGLTDAFGEAKSKIISSESSDCDESGEFFDGKDIHGEDG